MVNEKLYNKTVDILVQAYYHDFLEIGSYCACAVGNLIAANLGYRIIKDREDYLDWEGVNKILSKQWCDLVYNRTDDKNFNEPIAKYQIDSTGYSLEEIIKIETAFEGSGGETEDEVMFNGLMAVIDVLDEIHENEDADISKVSKTKFTKRDINKVTQ